jgi:hypothetical protein
MKSCASARTIQPQPSSRVSLIITLLAPLKSNSQLGRRARLWFIEKSWRGS